VLIRVIIVISEHNHPIRHYNAFSSRISIINKQKIPTARISRRHGVYATRNSIQIASVFRWRQLKLVSWFSAKGYKGLKVSQLPLLASIHSNWRKSRSMALLKQFSASKKPISISCNLSAISSAFLNRKTPVYDSKCEAQWNNPWRGGGGGVTYCNWKQKKGRNSRSNTWRHNGRPNAKKQLWKTGDIILYFSTIYNKAARRRQLNLKGDITNSLC
jgi:hypothetical protein